MGRMDEQDIEQRDKAGRGGKRKAKKGAGAGSKEDQILFKKKGFDHYASGESAIGNVVAQYDYVTADGLPYVRVTRTDEKKFPMSHWDEKKGAWAWGKPSGKIDVVYNLPDVLGADEVFICEGEKDADAVTGLGLVATTNISGAGKWLKELNKWFVHVKKVYIIEDNDDHGRNHATLVVNNLIGIVEEVRIVRLPGLPEKEDASWWLSAGGGTKKKLLEIARGTELATATLKVINVVSGEIARMVDDTQKAILETKRPVFVRGGMLVEPIWTKYPIAKGGETTATTFRMMGVENLRYMINKHDIFYRKFVTKGRGAVKATDEVFIDPPDLVISTLVRLGYWKFPRVSGIINAPTMRPDGSILTERGYDAATQLWCWPDEKLDGLVVKEKPSRKDAVKALELLKELIKGFAFQGELDRAVALASILGTVLRGAFDIAPMTLFLAHMSGTGKSYLVDLISTIITGKPCPVITATRNEDEMEKRIGSLLLESAPLISLDNMSFDLKSDVLCQMCTQQSIKIRILGKSETPNCEWRGMLFATGNNIRLVGDMARRGLICNMDAGVERPELRDFEFSPHEKVLGDPRAYVAAALTIARAYFISGEQVKCQKIGSYGDWSRFVREPLLWLGEADPAKSMEQAFKDDPNRETAERFLELWAENLGSKDAFRLNEVVEKAKETRKNEEFGAGIPDFVRLRPEFFDLLVERCGERGNIDARKFSYWMRSLRGQIHNGYKLLVETEDNKLGNKWKVIKI